MQKKTLILIAFIIAKFILQYLLISPSYDLHRDEYLHLDQGSHLAWGYISVPPMTSWFSRIIQLLGNGVFWVKFFPALFGALTIYLVWKTIEVLNGNLFALVLGALSILVSVILRINILFQPNSFDIFFWTLAYFVIIKYISTENSKWILLLGVVIGFGVLSKYNIIFLVLGLVPALLLTEHRNLFLNKYLYAAIAIAAIIALPNILWQVRNDFPTITQLKELSRTQLVNVNRADFIKEQILFFFSSIFVIIAGFVSFFIYTPFKKYRVFFWAYLFTLALFIYFKAKGYYAIGLYPVLIAFGSAYLERIFHTGWKKYLRPVSLVVVAALAIPFVLVAFPFLGPEKIKENSKRYKDLGLLRWEDGKDYDLPQDFADMIGWSGLARKVDSVYNKIEDKEHTLVFCDNYGQAGAINYYSAFKNIHAVSMNADYINWIPLEKSIKNIILVKDQPDEDPNRQREARFFETVRLVGENDNIYSREYGTKIFLLAGAQVNVNEILKQDIQSRKKRR